MARRCRNRHPPFSILYPRFLCYSVTPEDVTMDLLREIVRLAESGRVVRLGYRRPGDGSVAEYMIEPYRLHRAQAGPVLHAWQVAPPPEGRADGWRDFRLDRITAASDGGRSFRPRTAVTLGRDAPPAGAGAAADASSFQEWGDRPIAAMGNAEAYFRQLESAMLDGKVSDEEIALAESLRDRVEPHERKATHARVFASVLHEVLQDSRISHREELYLQNVRSFLDRLGWAP
jgi:hypothetical protein